MADTWETPHHPGPAMGTGLPTWRHSQSPSGGGSRRELCRKQRVVSCGKCLRVLRFWGGRSCEGWGVGALLALASVPLNFHVPSWVEQMLRELKEATFRIQRETLGGWRILAQPKEGAREEVSLPPLGPAIQGQCAPGRRGSDPVQGLRLPTSAPRAETGKQALLRALGRTLLGLPWPPWHLLQAQHPGPDLGINTRSPRQVARMPLATMLIWVTVVLMVGARCSLPGFPFRAM